MYKKIMVPVDLAHIEKLEKALETAADLSKHYDIPVCYVGVTSSAPGQVAHTPKEFASKLKDFAAEQEKKYGLTSVDSKSYTSHDPSIDLDETLIDATGDTGSDLVVMASHVPGLPEHIFASNAGEVAMHAKVSVFVIR
ncbi:MAG: universal stress protein [Rhodovibrionaceae bacterium]|nr:universal stress protein [Rhodovibrionaceae bacterium]